MFTSGRGARRETSLISAPRLGNGPVASLGNAFVATALVLKRYEGLRNASISVGTQLSTQPALMKATNEDEWVQFPNRGCAGVDARSPRRSQSSVALGMG